MSRRRSLAVILSVAATIACIEFVPAVLAGPPPIRFTPAGPPIEVGPMASTPVLHDLDADGDLDVVIVSGPCCGREPCAASGHVRVLLNDGRGGLTNPYGRIRLGETALGADVGDVNDDGIPDVVVHHHLSYEAAVLLGLGGGRFADPAYVTMHAGESPHVHSITLGDVDGDGRLDITATLVDDHALAVHLGDGTGAFRPATGQPFFAHRHPYAGLALEDLNGDGHLDAMMTDVRGNAVTVLVGSGTGMFSPIDGFRLTRAAPLASAERPMACALADLDGDGDLDALAFTDESPLAVVMRNEGAGAFVESDANPVDLGVPSIGGTLADLDGDGRADVVAGGVGSRRVSILLGRGGGGFEPPFRIDAGGLAPRVAVGDMDGDGRPDIVTGNHDGDGSRDPDTGKTASGTVSVLLNRG